MCQIEIEEALDLYLRQGLPALNAKLALLQHNDTITDCILRNNRRTQQSIHDFLQIEREHLVELNTIRDINTLSDRIHELFGGIPGIGEQTLNDYIYNQAYKNGIDPEANCVCFLTSPRIRRIANLISIAQLQQQFEAITQRFHELTSMQFVIFINKNKFICSSFIGRNQIQFHLQ